MGYYLARQIVAHQTECQRSRYTTGLVILWPALFAWMTKYLLGGVVTRVLRPLFAVRILYCTQCGSLWVVNGTASVVFSCMEYFTGSVESGTRVNNRVMFLHDLTTGDKERLEAFGAVEDGE